MLMAISVENGGLVKASEKITGTYVCPGCQQTVRLRRGTIRIPYFAHLPNQACDTFSEGETSEHLTGKNQLANWLTAAGGTVVLESSLKQLSQRPDLLVNDQLAVEFQCSPLSLKRFYERVAGYHRGRFQQLWVLGKPYLPKPKLNITRVSKFLVWHKQYGVCLVFWNTRTEQLQVLYQITLVPLLPPKFRTRAFSTWSDWRRWWHTEPFVRDRETINGREHARQLRTLQMGLRHKTPSIMKLQEACYQAGVHLASLPTWVYGKTYMTPCFTNGELAWRIPLYLWWRDFPKTNRKQRFAKLREVIDENMTWLPNHLWDKNAWRNYQLELRFRDFFANDDL